MSLTLQRSIARPEPNVKPAPRGVGRRMHVTNVTKPLMFQCLTTGDYNLFRAWFIPGRRLRPGRLTSDFLAQTP